MNRKQAAKHIIQALKNIERLLCANKNIETSKTIYHWIGDAKGHHCDYIITLNK